MRAIRVHAYGDQPRIDDIAAPGAPGPGHVGIDVVAGGVGSWDVGVADGRLARFVELKLPFVMGAELVGRVAAVGSGVAAFAVGDRVIANPGIVGAWAERVNVRASTCGPAPVTLDDIQAAALPVGAVTALQALDMLGLPEGSSLLILGAGGSVGRSVVQLARVRGLTVYALLPAWEMDQSRAFGAHEALDQARDWVTELDRSVDGVLDLIGGEALERSATIIRPGGRAVTTLAGSMRAPVASSISMGYLRMRSTTADLASVSAYVDEGELTLPVGAVLPMEDVAEALKNVRTRRDTGKQVLAR